MWGNHKTTWRHYRYLNEKGFDCVTFNLLMGSDLKKFEYHPVLKYLYKGVFYVWTRQIRSALDTVDGDKIVYAFSGPSLSAFWACEGRSDIKKFICDGGPFDKIYSNTRNFFYHEVGITNPFLNKIAAWLGAVIWGYQPIEKLHKILRQWKKSIPILSIRGKMDNIVAIESIDEIFQPHSDLKIQTIELQYGKHLDGMRDFPDQYCKALLPFVKEDLQEI